MSGALSIPAVFHDVLRFKKLRHAYVKLDDRRAHALADHLGVKESQVVATLATVRHVLRNEKSASIKATRPKRLQTIKLYASYFRAVCMNAGIPPLSPLIGAAESEAIYERIGKEFTTKLGWPPKRNAA